MRDLRHSKSYTASRIVDGNGICRPIKNSEQCQGVWQCFNNVVHWTAQQIPAPVCLLPSLTLKTFPWRQINNKYTPEYQCTYKNYSNTISYIKWLLCICSWDSCLKTKIINLEDIKIKKSKSILFVSFFCLPENAQEDLIVCQKKDLRKNYETWHSDFHEVCSLEKLSVTIL